MDTSDEMDAFYISFYLSDEEMDVYLIYVIYMILLIFSHLILSDQDFLKTPSYFLPLPLNSLSRRLQLQLALRDFQDLLLCTHHYHHLLLLQLRLNP